MKLFCIALILLMFSACNNDFIIRNNLYNKPEVKQRVAMLPINFDSLAIIHPDDFDAGFGVDWNEPTYIRLGKLIQNKLAASIGTNVKESGDEFVILPDSLAHRIHDKSTHLYFWTPTSREVKNQRFVSFILPQKSFLKTFKQDADIIIAINGIRIEPLSVSSQEYQNNVWMKPPMPAPQIPKFNIPAPRFKFQPLIAVDSSQATRIRSIPYMKGVSDSVTSKELRSGLKITGSFVVYSYSSPNPISYGTISYEVADKRKMDWMRLLDTFTDRLAYEAY